MVEPGKYLYCIIRCQRDHTFDVTGIGDQPGPVHTVCHKGIAAVISDTPVKQYESSRKNMMAHEKVLEMVTGQFTILPVRFGTVADSTTAVQHIQKLLASRADEFHGLLENMEGKVELGLKAFWRNDKAIFEEIVAENADIRRLRDSLQGKSPAATHFERIRLGEMVQEALNHKRVKEAARILPPLRRVASRVRENEVLLDRMIFNAAFLVEKSRVPEFDQAVNRLDEQLGQRIAVKYIGPTPAYNFVNIVVNWQELR